MSIQKNILVVCLLVAVCLPAGLINPVERQNSHREKTVMGGRVHFVSQVGY